MMVDLAPGWKTELDHGPEWLFVRMYGPFGESADATGLAESIQLLMQQEFVRRIVLELDGLGDLPQDFLHELFQLRDLVDSEGGILRLCGLCNMHRMRLSEYDFTQRFVPCRTREDAVHGFYRPNLPR